MRISPFAPDRLVVLEPEGYLITGYRRALDRFAKAEVVDDRSGICCFVGG